MQIHDQHLIEKFLRRHRDAERSLSRWIDTVRAAAWRTPHDVYRDFPTSDRLKGRRYAFNIRHNRYRIVAEVDYDAGIVYIILLDDHRGYDKY